jgi:hypothetical protein
MNFEERHKQTREKIRKQGEFVDRWSGLIIKTAAIGAVVSVLGAIIATACAVFAALRFAGLV